MIEMKLKNFLSAEKFPSPYDQKLPWAAKKPIFSILCFLKEEKILLRKFLKEYFGNFFFNF